MAGGVSCAEGCGAVRADLMLVLVYVQCLFATGRVMAIEVCTLAATCMADPILQRAVLLP